MNITVSVLAALVTGMAIGFCGDASFDVAGRVDFRHTCWPPSGGRRFFAEFRLFGGGRYQTIPGGGKALPLRDRSQ
ncbi:MAG: hypothetical protein WAM53_12805 [Terrimicrobiaceae bacterium]